jgi:hypothetical protein
MFLLLLKKIPLLLNITVTCNISNEAAWRALCRYWASTEFKVKSVRHSSNRGTESYHMYGGDNHFRLSKRMVSTI